LRANGGRGGWSRRFARGGRCRLLALALAIMLPGGAGAAAPADALVVSGEINLMVEHSAGRGPDRVERATTQMISSASKLIFQGAEQATDELRVSYVMENSVNAASGGGKICSLECWVGISNRLGTLRLGKTLAFYDDVSFTWYFPVGGNQNPLALWANCGNDAGGADGCLDTYVARAARFDSVRVNDIGLHAMVASPDAGGAADNGTRPVKRIYSVGAVYGRRDNVYLAIAHQVNMGVRAPGLRDQGTTVAGSIRAGAWYTGVGVERLAYQFAGNAPLTRDYVGVIEKYLNGPHLLWLNYGRAWSGRGGGAGAVVNAVRSRPASGATMVSAGYQYTFSKQTGVYLHYTAIDNQAQGIYSLSENAFDGASPGSRTHAWSLGIRKKF
jgi:predicted porin